MASESLVHPRTVPAVMHTAFQTLPNVRVPACLPGRADVQRFAERAAAASAAFADIEMELDLDSTRTTPSADKDAGVDGDDANDHHGTRPDNWIRNEADAHLRDDTRVRLVIKYAWWRLALLLFIILPMLASCVLNVVLLPRRHADNLALLDKHHVGAFGAQFADDLYFSDVVLVSVNIFAWLCLVRAAWVWQDVRASRRIVRRTVVLIVAASFSVMLLYPYRVSVDWGGLNHEVCLKTLYLFAGGPTAANTLGGTQASQAVNVFDGLDELAALQGLDIVGLPAYEKSFMPPGLDLSGVEGLEGLDLTGLTTGTTTGGGGGGGGGDVDPLTGLSTTTTTTTTTTPTPTAGGITPTPIDMTGGVDPTTGLPTTGAGRRRRRRRRLLAVGDDASGSNANTTEVAYLSLLADHATRKQPERDVDRRLALGLYGVPAYCEHHDTGWDAALFDEPHGDLPKLIKYVQDCANATYATFGDCARDCPENICALTVDAVKLDASQQSPIQASFSRMVENINQVSAQTDAAQAAVQASEWMLGTLMGLNSIRVLVPLSVSMVNGVAGGVVNMKATLPMSCVPGYMLVVAMAIVVPVYAGFMSALMQMLGDFLFIPTVTFMMTGVSAYGIFSYVFTHTAYFPSVKRAALRIKLFQLFNLLLAFGMCAAFLLSNERLREYIPDLADLTTMGAVLVVLDLIVKSKLVALCAFDVLLGVLCRLREEQMATSVHRRRSYVSVIESMRQSVVDTGGSDLADDPGDKDAFSDRPVDRMKQSSKRKQRRGSKKPSVSSDPQPSARTSVVSSTGDEVAMDDLSRRVDGDGDGDNDDDGTVC